MSADLSPEREAVAARIPPASIEAEQSLLGSVLQDNATFDEAAAIVRAEHFTDPRHRALWTAIGSLVGAHRPADIVTVFEAAAGRVPLAEINALANCVASSRSARRYAEMVAEYALRREVIAAAGEAVDAAWQPGPAAPKIDAIASRFDRLGRVGERSAPADLSSLLLGALDRYQALAEGTAEPGLRVCIPPLQRMLGGLKPGKLYGIAARPSVGKSSLARALCIGAAQDGHRTLLLSLEMPKAEVADCIVAALARVDGSRLQDGRLAGEDWGRVAEGIEAGAPLPLLIDDQGSLTLQDIRTKARGVRGLKLLALDYLQLCTSTLRGATTNDQIAELSKGLKALSLEMGIPIVVLSQLNREVEKRSGGEPQLADLRDSGAIEQDLDVALLLWTADEADGRDWRTVGCKVAKNRGGPRGRVALHFEPAIYRWSEGSFPAAAAAKPMRRVD